MVTRGSSRELEEVGTGLLGQPRARAPGVGRLILARRQPLGYDDFRTGHGPAIARMGGLRSLMILLRHLTEDEPELRDPTPEELDARLLSMEEEASV